MNYRIFRGPSINNLRTYMSRSLGKEALNSPNMFCLCGMDKGRVTGVGVFEAGDAARIYEINVTPDNVNKGLEKEILEGVCETLVEAGSKIVTMKIHEEDGFAFWEPFLLRNGFVMGKTSAFYHFLLVEAYASPIIKKASVPPQIVTLSSTPSYQRNEYDGRLKGRHQFEYMLDDKIAADLSAVYIQDGKIEGCFLVSEFKDKPTDDGEKESGIYVEYASTRGVKDPLALVEMIRFTMEQVWKVHVPDEHGYVLSMDSTVERIFQRIFPAGRLTGNVKEFIRSFE